jgi:uncharacterized protein YoxC
MSKAIKYVIVLAVCAGMIAALAYCYITPAAVRQETEKTEQAVDALDETNERFEREVVEHTEETETKVVVVRERVKKKIAALDPDGLANAMVHEIMLWRGTYADSPETHSGGIRR